MRVLIDTAKFVGVRRRRSAVHASSSPQMFSYIFSNLMVTQDQAWAPSKAQILFLVPVICLIFSGDFTDALSRHCRTPKIPSNSHTGFHVTKAPSVTLGRYMLTSRKFSVIPYSSSETLTDCWRRLVIYTSQPVSRTFWTLMLKRTYTRRTHEIHAI